MSHTTDCPTCNGAGGATDGYFRCPHCQGRGEVTITAAFDLDETEWDGEPPELCELCGGSGESFYDDITLDECRRCGGLGMEP
jgi:DnaJ-class molecular chaperone